MKILQFPLSRITLCFVLGIVFANYFNPNPKTIIILLLIFTILIGISYFLSKRDFIQKLHFGIFTYLLSFSIGISTIIIHNPVYSKSNYIHFFESETQKHILEITVREKLKPTVFYRKYIGIITKTDGKISDGKILLNLKKSDFEEPLIIGNKLIFHGNILKNSIPKNPDQFDYGKYLTEKGILAQVNLNNKNTVITSEIEKNIWYYSAAIREKIIGNLEKNNFRKEELNIVNALLLGQQQEIEKEILHDYQFAGAIHILSVSGLHIGFIVVFLNFILQRVPKNKTGNTIRFLTIFFFLWIFAIIAGLSPSVVRSVTMFSFLALGMFLKRETNIFHTLLISLLFILLITPSFLFDVGFQLSYTALFFILWIQPWLSKLWNPKNRIIKYFWDIITVSFAAQIGTFPLSIYYFHQFPGLFFVTNLVILPALGIIMALGAGVMILAIFNFVPAILTQTLQWSIYVLNRIINYIASFEEFVFQEIPSNKSILIITYLLIFSLFIWLQKPNFKKLILTLSLIIALQTAYFLTINTEKNQSEWIVFHSVKNTLMTERKGNKIIAFENQNTSTDYLIKNYKTAHFCKTIQREKLKNVAYFKDKKIQIIDSTGIYSENIKPDILILTHSPKINPERLIHLLKPKQIIADGSNFGNTILKWKETCLKEKIPFHATAEKGFYKIE
ncbi:MAG: ComEC/Rec2 family competence protein [Flavobacterium sp.]